MKSVMKLVWGTLALVCLPLVAGAQDEAPARTVFTNVAVWDGTSDALQPGMNVLVEGNKVARISL